MEHCSRQGLLMLLEAAGHDVVACAADGDELVALLRDHPADVAILDIRMPPEPDGGLLTAEVLREAYPNMGLLLLSHYAESHYLMRLLDIDAGSIGYRLKEKVGSVEVLTDTLTRIAAGEIVIEPALAGCESFRVTLSGDHAARAGVAGVVLAE